MRFDFSTVDDVDSYVSVPAGPHNVRIAEVREGRSRDGSTRWTFRLEVVDGDYAGRNAAWDSLTWSERGIFRVKHVLEAFGLDVRGELEIEPRDLVNLQAHVQVAPEEREDPKNGHKQIRMRVPYLGYTPIAKKNGRSNGAEPHAEVDDWRGSGESGSHASAGEDDELAF